MLPCGIVEIAIVTIITRDSHVLWMILKIPVSHWYYIQEEIHYTQQWKKDTSYLSLTYIYRGDLLIRQRTY